MFFLPVTHLKVTDKKQNSKHTNRWDARAPRRTARLEREMGPGSSSATFGPELHADHTRNIHGLWEPLFEYFGGRVADVLYLALAWTRRGVHIDPKDGAIQKHRVFA